MQKGNKIAILMTWYGPLPPYFDAWLRSAEKNPDVDFLCFSDADIQSASPNIICHRMSFEEQVELCAEKMKRKVSFAGAYKFCDARPFFGIIFEDYLKDYDFWGYCDIDLVFGKIRNFLTDDLLEKTERFFPYGHLSVFKNDEKMKHLYDLPGGIYSMQEIFEGKEKTTPEEYGGINRICQKNHISWYTQPDFADFKVFYPNRLEMGHGKPNYQKQIFVWQDGRAWQIYEENGVQKRQELIYMHWQKRKPVLEGTLTEQAYMILTPDRIYVSEDPQILETIDYEKWNPSLSEKQKKQCKGRYLRKKLLDFAKSDMGTKRIWLRQKIYKKLEFNRSYT